MAQDGGERYLWFDGVRVVAKDMQLMCVVAGRIVPLPVVILHPDCTLSTDGDVGRLGVPMWWAEQRGLCDTPPVGESSSFATRPPPRSTPSPRP